MNVLDEVGLQFVLSWVKALVTQATQLNMTATLDGNSTNAQIPGAKAVYDFVIEAIGSITKLTAEVVTTLPATGEPSVIYLIETAPGSAVKTQHMYIGGRWVSLGTTAIDLSNYWSKDELKSMTNTEIQTVIDDVMGV